MSSIARALALGLLASCGSGSSPEVRSDEALAAFAQSGRLWGLNCVGEGVTDAGLRVLEDCDCVEGIWLRACPRVDGSGFDVFGRMPRLTNVDVWNCPLRSDIAFDFLRETASVTELIVCNLKLTDESLTDIAAAKQLEILLLAEVEGITDDGIAALAAAKGLRKLTIDKCPDVTEEGIAHLHAALLECEIDYER